jgi:hypothetical protein
MDAIPKTKKAKSKKRAKLASVAFAKHRGSRNQKRMGTVLKIVNGKPVDKKLSAEKGFSDLERVRASFVCRYT